MKKNNTVLLLIMVMFVSQAFTEINLYAPNDIIGSYWSPKKDAKIEIYLKGQEYFGKFVWLKLPKQDDKNPVRSLQRRAVLGLEFLTGFSFSNGVYSNGEIYDPETGKTYSCKMTIEGNNLKVRGYIGISLFGRTEIFEKITNK